MKTMSKVAILMVETAVEITFKLIIALSVNVWKEELRLPPQPPPPLKNQQLED